MKSLFSFRCGVILGLVAMLFSSASLASEKLEPTWVKEGVNWEQYNKFLVQPLNVDNVKVVRPPWAEDDPKPWTIEIDSLEAVQAIFRDTMKDILGADGGYPLVYVDGKDVLEVEVEILAIMPWVRPGSDSTKDGMEIETLGSGELTASVELRDSRSRELLLLIEGDRAVGEEYQQWSAENNAANLERIFKRFATNLRAAMDRVHGK
jgi:hypothetical protein